VKADAALQLRPREPSDSKRKRNRKLTLVLRALPCRYPDDEIEEKVDELRKQLLAEYEKAKASGVHLASGAHGGGSHSVAEAKAQKMKEFGGALGIRESYVPGKSCAPAIHHLLHA
jgi:hypothetical protein